MAGLVIFDKDYNGNRIYIKSFLSFHGHTKINQLSNLNHDHVKNQRMENKG